MRSASTSPTATRAPPKPFIPGSAPTRPGRASPNDSTSPQPPASTSTPRCGGPRRCADYTDARSDTQVLVFRLDRILASTQRHRGGPPAAVPDWLAAAPPGRMPTPWDSYLPARYTEMAERISSLVIEATAEPARWLRQIGEGPGRDEALRQVVAYRAVYAIDGDDPLGPEPAQHTRHHQAWSTATTRHPGQQQGAAIRRRATRPAALSH